MFIGRRRKRHEGIVSVITASHFTRLPEIISASGRTSTSKFFTIQPNFEVYGRLENALNTRYQEVYGYNTAGFAAYAGVKIKFDDLLGTTKR